MSDSLRQAAEAQENAYCGDPIGLVASAMLAYMDEAGLAATREAMQVETIASLEAENARLSRWLKAAWGGLVCPECGVCNGVLPHAPGCEFAAWLESRKGQG